MELKPISAKIEVIGRMKDFGGNKRVNIKVRDGEVTWLSLVSKEEVVADFIEKYRPGDEILALCKIHEGRDYLGNPRVEYWIQEVSKLEEVEAVLDVVGVDKYVVDCINRAIRIVKKSNLGSFDIPTAMPVIAEVFSKIARHEHYVSAEKWVSAQRSKNSYF